jgi:hypothetical protein
MHNEPGAQANRPGAFRLVTGLLGGPASPAALAAVGTGPLAWRRNERVNWSGSCCCHLIVRKWRPNAVTIFDFFSLGDRLRGCLMAEQDTGASAPDIQQAAELLPVVYAELRRLAVALSGGLPPGQTLQPTALVHEAYVRLVGDTDPG